MAVYHLFWPKTFMTELCCDTVVLQYTIQAQSNYTTVNSSSLPNV